MKDILKKGEIKELLSDEGGGGWSKEAHLLIYGKEKYMLRRAQTLQRAKKYEELSKKLEKFGFLPKFLGRYGKDVIYEYIEGRDLRREETLKVIKQIGKIAGQINKVRANDSLDKKFEKQINEALTGDFKDLNKKVKPLLSKEKVDEIIRLYFYLKRKSKPSIRLDLNDASPSNFRLRKGKVYFVDIEAIKPRYKGYLIGKAFTKWFRTKNQQKAFLEGYNLVLSAGFINDYYLDFTYINYLVQEVNYTCRYGKKYKPKYKSRLKFLDEILKKYRDELK